MNYQTSPEGSAALSAAFLRIHGMYFPPPALTLSEWADQYAYIPPEAGAFPGKFVTAAAEYQRGIQDAISAPEIETVVLMMGSQSGKTQIQMNAIGYYSHHEPAPILFVAASEGEAEKFSKNRISKMIRSTPVLRKLFPSPRARDSGNTLLNKEFPGGVLVLAGANAPAGLASMPIRVLMPDEVDRYPESAGTEGDPVDLATRRTSTFWNRKHILASTPGVKNLSRIEKAYDESDRRRYFVPCPHCGTFQVLEWPRLQYREQGERVVDVFYACVEGCEIREGSKFEMIRAGQWRATAESRDGKTAGFHLNALYPPWMKWHDLVNEWRNAKTSLQRRQTFINTRLAETWEIRGKGADLDELEKRKDAANFADMLPAGVLFLTAGVDVQDDRLEASVWGWGMDEQRWVVDHRQFYGDPSLPEVVGGEVNAESPWAALQAFLRLGYAHEYGVTMRVACALVDSGGHHTQRVYDFTKKNQVRKWFAIVGRAGIGAALVGRETKQGPSRAKLYTVGVDTAKEDIYTSLNITTPGAEYTNFSAALTPEYFRQITSEQLVKVKKDFVTTLKWVKKSERNEALDCAVYARAAVAVLRPAYRAIKRALDAEAKRIAEAKAKEPEAAEPAPDPSPEDRGTSAVAEYQAEQERKREEYVAEQRRLRAEADKLRREQSKLAGRSKRRGWVNSW